MNIDVIGLWLGGRLGLLSKGRLEGGVLGAIRVDWVDLYRQDTRVHFGAADAGASLGAFGALRLGPVNLALQLEGVVMPTARLIEIPGAPARRFNLFGLRLGLAITWDFARERGARFNEKEANPGR